MAINIQDGQTMGQFVSAIEDYVKSEISTALKGKHGNNTLIVSAPGKAQEEKTFSVNLALPNTAKHYGIVNIKSSGKDAPQAQIFMWWDNNKFHYTIPRNSLFNIATTGTHALSNLIYIDENSVEMDGNSLKFDIVASTRSDNVTHYQNKNFTCNIDYHIW